MARTGYKNYGGQLYHKFHNSKRKLTKKTKKSEDITQHNETDFEYDDNLKKQLKKEITTNNY